MEKNNRAPEEILLATSSLGQTYSDIWSAFRGICASVAGNFRGIFHVIYIV